MKFELPQQVLDRYSNIKFHENSSSGSRAGVRTETDGYVINTNLMH